METTKPNSSRLPQDLPLSPVLFLIYPQAMLNPLTKARAVDAFYIDNDTMLQIAGSQENTFQILVERTRRYIERVAALNLAYDFGKSGPIHFYPKFSYLATKTNNDLQYLSKAVIIKNTITNPAALFHTSA